MGRSEQRPYTIPLVLSLSKDERLKVGAGLAPALVPRAPAKGTPIWGP